VQLTITTTHSPATDLGYLLHKNPARVQSFPRSFGQAYVMYPEATNERCTMALILDVDSVGLVRKRQDSGGFALEQYVNDRPYVASSFLSVALGDLFGTAMTGRCKERPDLVDRPIPLEARVSVIACRGGEGLLRQLFEPLGYAVDATPYPLDPRFPEWGESPYSTLILRAETRLRDLLTHLYVLIPVLDNDKHYWVGDDEVEKLLRRGEGWLGAHPAREFITHRYLKNQHSLTQDALARLAESDPIDQDEMEERPEKAGETVAYRLNLHEQRLQAVAEALRESGARSVLDLGCGEGRLLRLLLDDPSFERILGVDVSYRALERARERLHLDQLPERQRQRIALLHGSLTYRDRRLEGYEAAAVVEVIEHLDYARLAVFERVLFEFAHPRVIALTTPNQEYNRLFDSLTAGTFRHADHRFEWTREQFHGWANAVAERHGYSVRFSPIGPEDADAGAPSQMAWFTAGEVT